MSIHLEIKIQEKIMPLPKKGSINFKGRKPEEREVLVANEAEKEEVLDTKNFSLAPILDEVDEELKEELPFKSVGECSKQSSNEASKEAGTPDEIMGWLFGAKKAPPAQVSEVLADVSNKMGMYLAFIIVKRLSKLDSIFSYIEKIEKKLFDPRRDLSKTPESELRADYKELTAVAERFMEYSRKFAIQNRELITDPERDEVANLLRSADPETLKRLKTMIKGTMSLEKKNEEAKDG